MKVEVKPSTLPEGVSFKEIPQARVFQISEGGGKYLKIDDGVLTLTAPLRWYSSNNFGGDDYRVLPEGTQVIITT